MEVECGMVFGDDGYYVVVLLPWSIADYGATAERMMDLARCVFFWREVERDTEFLPM